MHLVPGKTFWKTVSEEFGKPEKKGRARFSDTWKVFPAKFYNVPPRTIRKIIPTRDTVSP